MSEKKATLEDYINGLHAGIENGLDQMYKAPQGAVMSVSDTIAMLSMFKSLTMEAKYKLLNGEIK